MSRRAGADSRGGLVRALLPLLLAGILAACAANRPPPPEAPAAPRPTPTAPAAESSPDPSPTTFRGLCTPEAGCVENCVLRDGRLVNVEMIYNPSSGTVTTATGRPFSEAFPADSTYAANARWYLETEPVSVAGGQYVKYGLPRVLGITDVVPAAAFRGVTVFAEPRDDPRRPEVIYVPLRPGCEFQPYARAGIK